MHVRVSVQGGFVGLGQEHTHLVRRLSYLSCCAWLNPSWGGLSGAGTRNPPNTTARTT